MTAAQWRSAVLREARHTGVDLSSHAVDELATHLEDLYLGALEAGASPAEAHSRAMAALTASGVWPLRQTPTTDLTEHRRLSMMFSIRTALRQFRSHPAFALLTVLVLGLGTGAATVVYTIVDSVVLRPLPYHEPDRLVTFRDTNPEKGLTRDPISPVTFMDYRALPAFTDAAAWWRPDVNLVDPGLDPVRIATIEASSNLFHLLGVTPQLGPGFQKEEVLVNRSELQVTISDRLWRSRYGADPAIIGRQLSMNDDQYTVVGVMPAGFRFPDDIDAWQRLTWPLEQHSRFAHFMEGVGRLANGVTIERARADGQALAERLGQEFAASNKGWAFGIAPLLDDQLGYYRPALYALFGAVGLLLLIGCLNVASLLLTRALSREREMAVRTALGAAPRQIVSQLVAESFVLSAAGAVAGLVLAYASLPLILTLTPVDIPRLAEASINVRVLLATIALVAAMTMVFGLVPALVLLKSQLAQDLRSGERGSSKMARRTYQALVVGEVALACALLVGSTLLVRTVNGMMSVPIGVDGRTTVISSLQISAPNGTQAGWRQVNELHAQVLDRLREQPGVTAAGTTNRLPLEAGWRNPLIRADQPTPQSEAPQAQHISVSDGFFETIGATVVEGRLFTDRDTADAEPVVILNALAAKRYFGTESAVGRQMRSWTPQIGPLGRNLTWGLRPDGARVQPVVRVVGVIADVQNVALGMATEPAVYFPTRQFPFSAVNVAINARDTATATAALKQALRDVTPSTPMGLVETWPDRLSSQAAEPRLLMTVLTVFGVLAALLAALGVYGLFSWSVAMRQRELAIRLTLGERPSSVGRRVIQHGLLLVTAGLMLGMLGVQGVGRWLNALLFGVATSDATSLIAAAGILLAASLIACAVPAVRAMRVDPVEGLRSE